MVSPLLGLLGTVIGMIETFDSLGDMSLYSQSGGIAGGISQALFTTQMGLAVSIPGLVVNGILHRRQKDIELELAQIKDILCTDQMPNLPALEEPANALP
jgi:biopolymer transport protein ExbB